VRLTAACSDMHLNGPNDNTIRWIAPQKGAALNEKLLAIKDLH
jgi:hypothetical protein